MFSSNYWELKGWSLEKKSVSEKRILWNNDEYKRFRRCKEPRIFKTGFHIRLRLKISFQIGFAFQSAFRVGFRFQIGFSTIKHIKKSL